MIDTYLPTLVFYSGIGQILLSLFSVAIPKMLDWNKELSCLKPLYRQMFWNYAGYILGINLFFGIISIWATNALLDQSLLAGLITGFITLYWGIRILIQFVYFDRSEAPKGLIFTLGEVALVGLFLLLNVVYCQAFIFNLSKL